MCMQCNVTVDPQRIEQFAETMLGHLNSAALAMMMSIGHRTGLFDTMAELPPSTAQRIADAAGLNERYVREWLGAMTTGRIVEHDPEQGTYRLPAEHAAWLTRAAGGDNLANTMQFISVMGGVESRIVDCFRNGGGVGYEHFERFNDVMADESNNTVVAPLHDHILPLVPGLTERLEKGIDVLDVGCGMGRALMSMAQRYPNSRFVGYDFLPSAIERAKAEADQRGLTNVRFQVQDAATFTDEAVFDLVTTFDAIHDQADPQAVLANLHRALRPDGVYLMQDIHASSTHAGDMDNPLAPFLYTVSTMHCMTVSLARDGAGLGTAWGRATALRMLAEAGFENVKVQRLDHDMQNDYFVCHPSKAKSAAA